jgi:hypothetical protein
MFTIFRDVEGEILDGATAIQSISRSQRFSYIWPNEKGLRGRRLSSGEEVIGAVLNWIKTQQKTFF